MELFHCINLFQYLFQPWNKRISHLDWGDGINSNLLIIKTNQLFHYSKSRKFSQKSDGVLLRDGLANFSTLQSKEKNHETSRS